MHRLEVEAPGGGSPLPMTVLRARRPTVVERLLGAALYVPKGPACAPSDAAAWSAALAALEALAEATAAATVTVEPPGWDEDRDAVRDRLEVRGWAEVATVQPAHTAIVDLRGGYAEVLARMRPKGRYNVRLAERRGVSVERLADPAVAAPTLARLCAATAARQGIHQPDAAHIRRVLAAVPGASVHVARVEGEAVAGVLVAAFAGEAIYLYGGSTDRHRERQPSALLHAAVMEDAITRGCISYDLWGIPADAAPDHPWHGLRQFKLSLGGVERSAPGAWCWTRRPGGSRVWHVIERARRARRRLGSPPAHDGDGDRRQFAKAGAAQYPSRR